jgi:hypothetical protein
MECVGLPGVNGNYDERNDEDYDPVEAGLKTLVGRWASKFGTKNGRSQDVWTVYDRALGLIDPRITDAAAGALAIGNVIGKKMLDNVYNGWFVRRRGKVRGSVTWYLERAQEEATDEAA